MRRALIVVVLLGLSACSAPTETPAGRQRTDEIGEARPGEVRRAWRPLNDQAATMAGALTITPHVANEDVVTLAFAEGVTVRARALAPDKARQAMGAAFAEIPSVIGAAETLEPWVYEVETETVAMSAPRGGLCGGLRTSFIAVAEFVNPENEWILRLASFHRDPETAAEPHLCFAFDYGLAAN